MEREFPSQFSSPLKKVLNAISIGTPQVLGSADDPKVMYSADYDLMNMVAFTTKSKSQFQQLVRDAGEVGKVTDIKCGEVAEWQLLQSRPYNQEKELKHASRLWQDGVITADELKYAKRLLKTHLTIEELFSARKELRFGVLRWTPAEIQEGVKKYRGRVFRLEEAMKSTGITKVDVIAWVETKYIEASSIILWTKNGVPYADLPELSQSIGEDILLFMHEGRFMKVAKRMYSVAKYKGLVADQQALLSILNSHLGAIYTVVSDLELLHEFPDETRKHRQKEMDLLRDRFAKLYFDEFQGATPSLELLPRLKKVLEEEARKALELLQLLPLSPDYKPKRS